MTKDDFDRKLIGKETAFIVEFDVRPFGTEQRDAVGVFLGKQMLRHSAHNRMLSGLLKPAAKDDLLLTVRRADTVLVILGVSSAAHI